MNSWSYLTRDEENRRGYRGAGAYFGRKPDLCHRDLVWLCFVPAILVPTVGANHIRQRPRLDSGADAPHELQVVVQVVDGVEPRAEDFVASVEVAQVGAGEIAAGVAGAGGIERAGIRLVSGVADVHHA